MPRRRKRLSKGPQGARRAPRKQIAKLLGPPTQGMTRLLGPAEKAGSSVAGQPLGKPSRGGPSMPGPDNKLAKKLGPAQTARLLKKRKGGGGGQAGAKGSKQPKK